MKERSSIRKPWNAYLYRSGGVDTPFQSFSERATGKVNNERIKFKTPKKKLFVSAPKSIHAEVLNHGIKPWNFDVNSAVVFFCAISHLNAIYVGCMLFHIEPCEFLWTEIFLFISRILPKRRNSTFARHCTSISQLFNYSCTNQLSVRWCGIWTVSFWLSYTHRI